jgi:ELWxxDGT repeat protein
VVFFATDDTGQGLWVSDGTAAGTQRLAASTGETLSQMRFLTRLGAQAFSPRPRRAGTTSG